MYTHLHIAPLLSIGCPSSRQCLTYGETNYYSTALTCFRLACNSDKYHMRSCTKTVREINEKASQER